MDRFSETTKRRRIAATVSSILNELDVKNTSRFNSTPINTNSLDRILSNQQQSSLVTSSAENIISDQNQGSSVSVASIYGDNYFQINESPCSQCESNSSDSDNEEKYDIRANLASWSVRHNITHVALKELIQIFRNLKPFVDLPHDQRTLLKTPKEIIKTPIGTGFYTHFGIKAGILRKLAEGLSQKTQKLSWLSSHINLISICIGIDGLPLSGCSNTQIWPILCSVDQSICQKPFSIGVFGGKQKPELLNLYLKDFVSEMVELEDSEILFNDIKYVVRIRAIIDDAPARSFLKSCCQFNGYNGCERCTDKGRYDKEFRKVIFSELNASKRIDTDLTSPHFTAISPLTSLKLGIVSQFPLNYMHMCCLGVMRKLMYIRIKGDLVYRLSASQIFQLSEHLKSLTPYISHEFARKPRLVREIDHWKATEYRQLLLYTGIVVLKNRLSAPRYQHFLTFCAAMHILLSKNSSNEGVRYAENLLRAFVHDFITLYSRKFLVYNIHSLIHLADDYRKFGSLDNISAFRFENEMQTFKRMTRGRNRKLEQIALRLSETNSVGLFNHKRIAAKHRKSIIIPDIGYANSNTGNNCFLTQSGDIVLISEFTNSKKKCVCKKVY